MLANEEESGRAAGLTAPVGQENTFTHLSPPRCAAVCIGERNAAAKLCMRVNDFPNTLITPVTSVWKGLEGQVLLQHYKSN